MIYSYCIILSICLIYSMLLDLTLTFVKFTLIEIHRGDDSARKSPLVVNEDNQRLSITHWLSENKCDMLLVKIAIMHRGGCWTSVTLSLCPLSSLLQFSAFSVSKFSEKQFPLILLAMACLECDESHIYHVWLSPM